MAYKDFATSLVATAPSTPTAGTTLVVTAGEGTRFRPTPFYATIHPSTQAPTLDNSEIVEVTNISIDTLTIVRAQKSTTAQTVAVGYRISESIYASDMDKLAGIEALADVTDTANVTAAGALMDSEVDANIKTLSLPASTTISTFGASLADDAAASDARTTLGLGALAVLGTVGTSQIDDASVTSGKLNFTVSSQANAGTAGGTIYYINLGGMKMAWGMTGSLATGGAAPASSSYGITWPTGFFSTVTMATVSAAAGTASNSQYIYAAPNSTVSTTSWAFYLASTAGTAGTTSRASFFAIGT